MPCVLFADVGLDVIRKRLERISLLECQDLLQLAEVFANCPRTSRASDMVAGDHRGKTNQFMVGERNKRVNQEFYELQDGFEPFVIPRIVIGGGIRLKRDGELVDDLARGFMSVNHLA